MPVLQWWLACGVITSQVTPAFVPPRVLHAPGPQRSHPRKVFQKKRQVTDYPGAGSPRGRAPIQAILQGVPRVTLRSLEKAHKTTKRILAKTEQRLLDLAKLQHPLLLPRQPLGCEAGACGKAGPCFANSPHVPKVPC